MKLNREGGTERGRQAGRQAGNANIMFIEFRLGLIQTQLNSGGTCPNRGNNTT